MLYQEKDEKWKGVTKVDIGRWVKSHSGRAYPKEGIILYLIRHFNTLIPMWHLSRRLLSACSEKSIYLLHLRVTFYLSLLYRFYTCLCRLVINHFGKMAGSYFSVPIFFIIFRKSFHCNHSCGVCHSLTEQVKRSKEPSSFPSCFPSWSN